MSNFIFNTWRDEDLLVKFKKRLKFMKKLN